MREGVKHLVVSHRGELVGQVSVSIGVAAFPEHGRSEAALVRAAEAALYEAKRKAAIESSLPSNQAATPGDSPSLEQFEHRLQKTRHEFHEVHEIVPLTPAVCE